MIHWSLLTNPSLVQLCDTGFNDHFIVGMKIDTCLHFTFNWHSPTMNIISKSHGKCMDRSYWNLIFYTHPWLLHTPLTFTHTPWLLHPPWTITHTGWLLHTCVDFYTHPWLLHTPWTFLHTHTWLLHTSWTFTHTLDLYTHPWLSHTLWTFTHIVDFYQTHTRILTPTWIIQIQREGVRGLHLIKDVLSPCSLNVGNFYQNMPSNLAISNTATAWSQ